MVEIIDNEVQLIDIHLEFLSQQMDFIKWVRKTHPSTYYKLKKAYEGAMKND